MNAIEREAIRLTGPWILYDGTCRICRAGEVRFGPMMRRRGLRLATLQSAVGRAFAKGPEDEMKVITRSGRVIGGAEAVVHLCRYVWWVGPIGWLWRVKVGRRVMEKAYRHVAAHRHCVKGTCELASKAAQEVSP